MTGATAAALPRVSGAGSDTAGDTQPVAIRIRVIRGPRTGATIDLVARATIRLSTSFGADIVLRDPRTPFAATLDAMPGRPARLTVETGEAALLGLPLTAGQSCIWPAFTPLCIGPHMLAHGWDDAQRWADTETLADCGDLASGSSDDDGAARDAAGTSWLRALRDLIPVPARRPLCGGIALAAMLATLAVAPVPSLPMFGPSPDRAMQLLEEQGISGLTVERQSDGVLQITGAVADSAALAKASAGLQAAGIAHRLDVSSGEELAAAAAEVARVRGIPAAGRATGNRDVTLAVAPMDPEGRQLLIAAIRSDVPEIERLVLEDSLAPVDTTPPRTVSEAAKRVATVVAGNPGYVLTADGGRYFPGATMPSGHVLRGIEEGAILIERNGAVTRIRF